MSILDDNAVPVIIWSEVEQTDDRGDKVRVPCADVDAVTLHLVQAPIASNYSNGTVTTLANLWGRGIPTGPWGKANFDGRDWDLVGEVELYHGSIDIWQALVRARSPRKASNG